MKNENSWPKQSLNLPDLSKDDNELKKPTGQLNVIDHGSSLEPLFSRYSSWDTLRRAIAWMARFKKYMLNRSSKGQHNVPRGPLTVVEVTGAENDIVKVVQNDAFPKEVDRTSPIHDLNLSFH